MKLNQCLLRNNASGLVVREELELVTSGFQVHPNDSAMRTVSLMVQ